MRHRVGDRHEPADEDPEDDGRDDPACRSRPLPHQPGDGPHTVPADQPRPGPTAAAARGGVPRAVASKRIAAPPRVPGGAPRERRPRASAATCAVKARTQLSTFGGFESHSGHCLSPPPPREHRNPAPVHRCTSHRGSQAGSWRCSRWLVSSAITRAGRPERCRLERNQRLKHRLGVHADRDRCAARRR